MLRILPAKRKTPALARARQLLRLRPRQAKLALRTKYVAVEACNPPTPARGDIEVADSSIDMWTDPVPIKSGIFLDEIRRRLIAQLLVQADFLEFAEKCI